MITILKILMLKILTCQCETEKLHHTITDNVILKFDTEHDVIYNDYFSFLQK